MIDPLSRLAIRYGTDKFGYHDYTPNYHKLLCHLRDKPVRILEIGVGGYADDDRGGQSLEVWRDYFEKGEVTGIDIQKKTMDLGERVKILQGSQVDADFLEKLVADRGPFDIIIDDGSHRNEHIVASYKLLFPTLAPGGVYVAEDVQTSFHPRFGGSLTLDEPNSVGYFGALMQQLNSGSDDPLIRDVASMERFHNMVALYKRSDDGSDRDVFASNRFEGFAGRKVDIAIIGATDFEASRLPVEIGDIRKADWSGKEPEDAAKGSDILMCFGGSFDHARIERLFGLMKDQGIFVLLSDDPTQQFHPDSELMSYFKHRFTMVDHVEILVHYPEADIDNLASQIYSIERYSDAVLLFKAPNTYPSNFAFDASNAQASRALAQMDEVLRDSDIEGGLVQYADVLTRHRSRESASAALQRLGELGASSRRFYQMAGALAQKEKRLDDARALFSAALKKFPLDPQFCTMLSGVLVALGERDGAEEILRSAYKENPRARAVVAQLTRICQMQGKVDEAIALGEQSINLFPLSHRPKRLIILAQMQRSAGRFDDAGQSLEKALDLAPDSSEVLAEQVGLLLSQKRREDARALAQKALEKHPKDPSLEGLLASASE